MTHTFDSNSHLYLVDGTSVMYRSFFGIPPMYTDDTNVNAVYGLCNLFMSYITGGTLDGFKPTHVAVVFDAPGPNFRTQLYEGYKSGRSQRPDDLAAQEPFIDEAVEAFGFAKYTLDGVEADDIIATLTKEATTRRGQTTIVTVDKDMMQLVNDDYVRIYDPMKKMFIFEHGVNEKFGVWPEYVHHVQALCGDKSDNIPGVPGIGIKTAAKLIREYGSVSQVIAAAHNQLIPGKTGALIREYETLANISERLTRLKTDVAGLASVAGCVMGEPDRDKLYRFLVKMGFNSLSNRLLKYLETQDGK